MGIQGLTGLAPQARRLGKMFKGGPKKTKKRANGGEYQVFGEELDYWRFEPDKSAPFLARVFEEAFAKDAGKPRHIPVFLPFPHADDNFSAWKEAYVAGGIEHRCDGQTCVLWYDAASNEYRTDPKPCPTLTMTAEDAKYRGCKQVGRLEVIIPALNELGVVTVETHSKHDIRFFDSKLPFYEGLQPDGLRRIPFILSRVQREIATPRDGKRVHVKKWLVELHVDPDWSVKFLSAQRQLALAAVEMAEPLLLTAAAEEEDDEQIGEATPVRAMAATASTNGAVATVSTSDAILNDALLKHCIELKKNERAGKAWFDAQYGRLTFEQKQKTALDLGLTVAAYAPPDLRVIDAELVEEGM